MKVFPVLIALLVCAASARAQRPNGFVDIPWGAPAEEAKRILSARPGVIVPSTSVATTGHAELDCTGGEFAGQKAKSWSLEFVDGKFFAGTVVIQSPSANALYREFKQHLITKYGAAKGEKRLGSTNERSDRMDRSKAKSGNIAYWQFNPNLTAKDTVTISCELNLTPTSTDSASGDSGVLTVRYVNETMKPPPSAQAAERTVEAPERPVRGGDL